MQSKNYIRPLIGAAVILAIPAFCMIFRVEGWAWGPLDFIIMGALIYAAGLTYDFLALKTQNTEKKLLIGLVVFLVLAAIWVELAVEGVSQYVQLILG